MEGIRDKLHCDSTPVKDNTMGREWAYYGLKPGIVVEKLLINRENPAAGINDYKLRSMRMDTPHDMSTHMLDNPEQYITRAGRFIRAHSLDELPQIWDILVGNMSVIGPRPGLWNQDLLTAERDKYGANDIKPGLTGWAQINGRDELEIPDKAKLDGEYASAISTGKGLRMDIKCFLGSLHVFSKDDSVVEGGTGEMKRSGK